MCCCCQKSQRDELLDDFVEDKDFRRIFDAGAYSVVAGLKREIGRTNKDAPIPQATILFWLGLDEKGEAL
jgi:hypothetical protein